MVAGIVAPLRLLDQCALNAGIYFTMSSNFCPFYVNEKVKNPTPYMTQCGRYCVIFFPLKHRNRLFWKGITSKPRYRVDQEGKAPTIFHLKYTSDGVSIPNRCLVVVSRGKALDILRYIHRGSSEGGCQVVGVNHVLVKQFSLEFFCNGIKALAKEFLKSCPDCQLHKFFPTVAPPPRPIRTFGPFERLQADIIDMAPGKKRSFMTNNRGQYRYILVIKDCFSKFCWLKQNPQTKSIPLCTIFSTMTKVLQNIYKQTMGRNL